MRMRNRATAYAFVLVAALMSTPGMSAPDRSKSKEKPADLSGVAKYRVWTLVNRKPHYVLGKYAFDCRAPSPPDPSPHGSKYIRVFVNASGRSTMMSKAGGTYPQGSIIVKEKLPD